MPSDLKSPMAFLKRRISSAVEIREVNKDKKQYLALLMSADEQENMIDRKRQDVCLVGRWRQRRMCNYR